MIILAIKKISVFQPFCCDSEKRFLPLWLDIWQYINHSLFRPTWKNNAFQSSQHTHTHIHHAHINITCTYFPDIISLNWNVWYRGWQHTRSARCRIDNRCAESQQKQKYVNKSSLKLVTYLQQGGELITNKLVTVTEFREITLMGAFCSLNDLWLGLRK